jgi:hypothetical protein
MSKLANFVAAAPRTFKEIFVAGVIFSPPVASGPQSPDLERNIPSAARALDGRRPRSHGAAMTAARNRFFGICREIICA